MTNTNFERNFSIAGFKVANASVLSDIQIKQRAGKSWLVSHACFEQFYQDRLKRIDATRAAIKARSEELKSGHK